MSLVAVAAAGACGYFAFQRDLRASRERLRGNSRVVETQADPIEYAEDRGHLYWSSAGLVEDSIREWNLGELLSNEGSGSSRCSGLAICRRHRQLTHHRRRRSTRISHS
jgi:hypothetical protein